MLNGQMKSLQIEPCILVTDRLSVERAVTYSRTDQDVKMHPDGSEDSTWKTDRHYRDRNEAIEADRVYSRARARIRAACIPTDIGFICPTKRVSELEAAIADAKHEVDEANSKFKHCQVTFRVVCTRIEPDNLDGAATLAETLNHSVGDLKASLENFDFQKARNVLNSTKYLVDVLSDPETRNTLQGAREQAKSLATEVANLVRSFDGNIANAMASVEGKSVIGRVVAAWNF